MPSPALPVPFADSSNAKVILRSYLDAARRPMTGVVTVTQTQPPFSSVSFVLVDGTANIRVDPGTYKLTAMLRTVDKVRSFLSDDLIVT